MLAVIVETIFATEKWMTKKNTARVLSVAPYIHTAGTYDCIKFM